MLQAIRHEYFFLLRRVDYGRNSVPLKIRFSAYSNTTVALPDDTGAHE